MSLLLMASVPTLEIGDGSVVKGLLSFETLPGSGKFVYVFANII